MITEREKIAARLPARRALEEMQALYPHWDPAANWVGVWPQMNAEEKREAIRRFVGTPFPQRALR